MKSINGINKKSKRNAGMTYAELIVVLGIFSVLSAVVIFKYGEFQAKVDIKNLASDIALKIVEAQKSSLSGKLPPASPPDWKPSYGVHFDIPPSPTDDNKSFIYFADTDTSTQAGSFEGSATSCTGECLEKTVITKGNIISSLGYYQNGVLDDTLENLTVTFSRISSGVIFYSTNAIISGATYVQITIRSPEDTTGIIKLYPSGRIQVN